MTRQFSLPTVLVFILAMLAAGCPGPTKNSGEYANDASEALKQGRVTEARALAELAIEDEPRDPDTRKLIAEVLRTDAARAEASGNLREAFRGYLAAAEQEPYRRVRASDLSRAVSLGRDLGEPPEKLLDIALRAVAADPADMDIRRTTAKLADTAGELDVAIENYLWVWEADRSDTALGMRLGVLYQQAERYEDAAAIFDRVLEVDEDHVQARIMRAEVFEAQGHAERARRAYRELMEKFPDNPGVLFRYASFLERQGDTDRAEDVRARARKLLPGVKRRRMRKLR